MDFIYRNTTQIYYTKSLGEDLNDFIKNAGFQRLLIVTGGNSTKAIAETIQKELSIDSRLFDGIQTNPLSEKVEEIVKQAKDFTPDAIITVGGGSVHDTGKAIAIMLNDCDGNITEDYTVNGKLSVPGIKKVLPVITIPTIFGSGAEVSPAALIRIGQEKRVIFSPLLHPLACFINIEYAKGLSKDVIARSAFDSLIQALEGFVSLAANNISNAFARITIDNFNTCLPYLIEGKYTNDVLEKISIASIFSSYVCSTASVGAIHAISDPISGRFNVHHGTALAMVAKEVLQKNIRETNESVVKELDALLSNMSSNKHDLRDKVVDKIGKIVNDLCLLSNVKKRHVDKDVISRMVKESHNGDMIGNPYSFSDEEIECILRNWYED